MAKLEMYSCDHCGIQKTKANGWFRVYSKGKLLCTIQPWDSPPLTEGEIIIPPTLIASEELHYCSEICVAKSFSKTMGHGLLAERLSGLS